MCCRWARCSSTPFVSNLAYRGEGVLTLADMYDVETDLRRVGQKVLSIFQSEARMNRVTMNLSLSKAFEDHSLDTVMTDPVRLTQMCVLMV